MTPFWQPGTKKQRLYLGWNTSTITPAVNHTYWRRWIYPQLLLQKWLYLKNVASFFSPRSQVLSGDEMKAKQTLRSTFHSAEASQDRVKSLSRGARICHAVNTMKNFCQNIHRRQPTMAKFPRWGIPISIMSPYLSPFPCSHPVSQSNSLGGTFCGLCVRVGWDEGVRRMFACKARVVFS